MKLIKSGSAFPLLSLGGVGNSNARFSRLWKCKLKVLRVLSFSFLHFLHIKFLFPFCFKVHCPENKDQFFSARGFGIRAVFSTLAEWFTVVTALFSRAVLCCTYKIFVSQITDCGAFSPVYASLHEIEGKCDYISACCVCADVIGMFLHFCKCVCVHMNVFHLTIHPGSGSICLSDHLMWV